MNYNHYGNRIAWIINVIFIEHDQDNHRFLKQKRVVVDEAIVTE